MFWFSLHKNKKKQPNTTSQKMHKYSNAETTINNCLDTYHDEEVTKFVEGISQLLESLKTVSSSAFTYKKSAIQNTHEISFDITGTIPTKQLSKFKLKYPRSEIKVINSKQVLLVPKKLVTFVTSPQSLVDYDSDGSMGYDDDDGGEQLGRTGKGHTTQTRRRWLMVELGGYSIIAGYAAYLIIAKYVLPSELVRALSQMGGSETDG